MNNRPQSTPEDRAIDHADAAAAVLGSRGIDARRAEVRVQELVPKGPLAGSGAARVRVRYCECDPMGVAHHASYVPWLEIARTELLRGCGVSYAELERAGVLLVVVKLEVRYRRPAKYDDVLDIRVRVDGTSRVKIEHAYEVVRVCEGGESEGSAGEHAAEHAQTRAGDEVLSIASSTLACVDRAGKPRELPDWLRGR